MHLTLCPVHKSNLQRPFLFISHYHRAVRLLPLLTVSNTWPNMWNFDKFTTEPTVINTLRKELDTMAVSILGYSHEKNNSFKLPIIYTSSEEFNSKQKLPIPPYFCCFIYETLNLKLGNAFTNHFQPQVDIVHRVFCTDI